MAEVHISLTGHRAGPKKGIWTHNIDKDPNWQKVKRHLESAIEQQLKTHDVVWCHSGLALGADTIWSKAVFAMQDKFGKNRVKLHAHIPGLWQKDNWFDSSKKYWQEQRDRADKETIYSPNEHYKSSEIKYMQIRNKGMLDSSDFCIAIWNGKLKGGTYNAVKYGKQKGLPLYQLNPTDVEKE